MFTGAEMKVPSAQLGSQVLVEYLPVPVACFEPHRDQSISSTNILPSVQVKVIASGFCTGISQSQVKTCEGLMAVVCRDGEERDSPITASAKGASKTPAVIGIFLFIAHCLFNGCDAIKTLFSLFITPLGK